MINYDKQEIREKLDEDDIFQLLQEFGGDPIYTAFGIISSTICHNSPGEGSRKLYWYANTGLFHCYTGCEEPSFDPFELVQKVAKIQWKEDYDLNTAVRWVARRFGISGTLENGKISNDIEDWKLLANYERIQEIEIKENTNIVLKEYDKTILDRFNYKVRIDPWLKEGISQKAIEIAQIGFYPGGDQITIPHFDKDNRLVGIRGRTLSIEEGERFGKYRPLKINKQLYNHPLGLSIYGLNLAKKNIATIKKAIIFESEKAVLRYISEFGLDNDIAVACCGSSISNYQIQLLLEAGAEELIIAFDRDFEKIGDEKFKHIVKNYSKLYKKYKNIVNISFILDKNLITKLKSSPIDEDKEKFLKLFKERVVL